MTTVLDDETAVFRDASRSRRFGFGAKLCIHPRQVPVVHRAFAPSAAQLRWAQRVLEACRTSQGATVQLEGRMIDRPVLLLAESIVRQAEASDAPRARP